MFSLIYQFEVCYLVHQWFLLGMCNSDRVLEYSAVTAMIDHENDDHEKKKKKIWLL